MTIQSHIKSLSEQDKEFFHSYAEEKFRKLEPLLGKFDPDTVVVHLDIEHTIKHNAYILKAHLELPGNSIHFKDAKHTLTEIIDTAYENLVQQIRKDKDKHKR